ncbi:MAG TPA: carboxypeptidase regulatory-like domain-containing protein [Aridibacter sp.]|nr:carboxypeptidase regulatory-like domain-containing protein [Aridibacter sp.]
MVKKSIMLVAFVTVTVLAAAPEMYGCVCKEKPSTLDSFEEADYVVIARVKGSNFETDSKLRATGYPESRRSTLVIEKSYKGEKKVGADLILSNTGFNSCTWNLDRDSIGDRYLLYLGPSADGKPVTFRENGQSVTAFRMEACGRSTITGNAYEDLLYLENLEEVRGRSRISGKYLKWTLDDPPPRISGREVKIIGEKDVWSVKTDGNGVFQIYDLSEGLYWIEAEAPAGWRVSKASQPSFFASSGEKAEVSYDGAVRIPVYLHDRRNASLEIAFRIYNRVSGRVLGPDERPLKGVSVRALEISRSESSLKGPSATTDQNGQFVFEDLAEGKYYLIAFSKPANRNAPAFSLTYYPGQKGREWSTHVSIVPGTVLSGLEFRIPGFRHTARIRGRLKDPGGVPIGNASVEFVPISREDWIGEDLADKTDANGEFEISVLKGSTGVLRATKYVSRSEISACSALRQYFEARPQSSREFRSNDVEITAENSRLSAQLVINIPHCPD